MYGSVLALYPAPAIHRHPDQSSDLCLERDLTADAARALDVGI
jgi:hypothetical protein